MPNNFFSSAFISFGNKNRKLPLAPNPNKAILTAIKAKWYHWLIEKILVSNICRVSVPPDITNIPK